MILPHEAQPLLTALPPAFTMPTFHRFTTLVAAAILTTGRRTIANLLRTLGGLATGHRTSYQRVLSQAQWSGLQLACMLTRFLVQHLLPQGLARPSGPVVLRRRQPKAEPTSAHACPTDVPLVAVDALLVPAADFPFPRRFQLRHARSRPPPPSPHADQQAAPQGQSV